MKLKKKLKKLPKNSPSIEIFDGKKRAEKILLSLKKRISEEKLKPELAVILIGEDKTSKLYIELKRKAARKIGVKLTLYKFKATAKQQKIIQRIKTLNNSSLVHGIVVQLPLPQKFNSIGITGAISPGKDVDGFHEKSNFSPVLPLAILLAVKSAVKSFEGKKTLALVNSDIFGKTLQKFFKKKKISINYVLRNKISQSDLEKKTRSADIIITVCGIPNLIKGDMIKRGAVLIDAGIIRLSGKRVVGDVNRESVKEKASFLTPVPGGLGPLTVVLLLKNTYLAAKKI